MAKPRYIYDCAHQKLIDQLNTAFTFYEGAFGLDSSTPIDVEVELTPNPNGVPVFCPPQNSFSNFRLKWPKWVFDDDNFMIPYSYHETFHIYVADSNVLWKNSILEEGIAQFYQIDNAKSIGVPNDIMHVHCNFPVGTPYEVGYKLVTTYKSKMSCFVEFIKNNCVSRNNLINIGIAASDATSLATHV